MGRPGNLTVECRVVTAPVAYLLPYCGAPDEAALARLTRGSEVQVFTPAVGGCYRLVSGGFVAETTLGKPCPADEGVKP